MQRKRVCLYFPLPRLFAKHRGVWFGLRLIFRRVPQWCAFARCRLVTLVRLAPAAPKGWLPAKGQEMHAKFTGHKRWIFGPLPPIILSRLRAWAGFGGLI